MKILRSILLVDDDEITLFINKRIVTNAKAAYQVETQNNGWDALAYLNECEKSGLPLPDLILTDIQMPNMDGWGFLESIKRLRQQTPITIVLLSGVLHPDHYHLCKRYNVDFYLLKPLTNKLFAELLEDLEKDE